MSIKSYFKKLDKEAKLKHKRRQKRTELIGDEGMNKQNQREVSEKVKAAFSKKRTVDKAKASEAVKRVGEYKKGKFSGFSKGGKTKMRPVCRGMGKATRGGTYNN